MLHTLIKEVEDLVKNNGEKEKVLVLNSGGFDSAILISLLAPYCDIISVTFRYGQPPFEIECASNICSKNNVKQHFLVDAFGIDAEMLESGAGFIPFRNLQFIFQAISFALDQPFRKIFVAFTGYSYFQDGENSFSDTTPLFVSRLNALLALEKRDLKVYAPLNTYSKEDLFPLAKFFNLERDVHYHSCNRKVPCTPLQLNKCADCAILDELEESYEKNMESQDSVSEKRLINMKIAINNTCNLSCSYCYFHAPYLKSENFLTLEEWEVIFEKARRSGVRNIEITALEPFQTPEKLLSILKMLEMFDVKIITNGTLCTNDFVNSITKLPQFEELIVSIGGEHNKFRNNDLNNLCLEGGKRLSFSWDLLKSSLANLKVLISDGFERPVYVKTIFDCHTNKYSLDPEEYELLIEYFFMRSDSLKAPITFHIHYPESLKMSLKFHALMSKCFILDDYEIAPNVFISPETGCQATKHPYLVDGVFVTVDGRVLTCPYHQFHDVSMPNLRDYSFDIRKALNNINSGKSNIDTCLSKLKSRKNA